MNKLIEEVALRRIVRGILDETRRKVNRGWEGYEQGSDADNSDILAGYPAAYHRQYADVTQGYSHLSDVESGGENVVARKRKRRRK